MRTQGKQAKKPPVPAKPQHTIVHLKFEDKQDLALLETIRQLTGTKVATKAILEALANYPNLDKKAKALNQELIKVNRELEQHSNNMATVRRAFNIINQEAQTMDKNNGVEGFDLRDRNACQSCGHDEFDEDGDCTECGANKYDDYDDDES